jgi:DnaJ-class molecular chaperone
MSEGTREVRHLIDSDLRLEEKCSSCGGSGSNYGPCYTCKGTGYELTDFGGSVLAMVRRRLVRED